MVQPNVRDVIIDGSTRFNAYNLKKYPIQPNGATVMNYENRNTNLFLNHLKRLIEKKRIMEIILIRRSDAFV